MKTHAPAATSSKKTAKAHAKRHKNRKPWADTLRESLPRASLLRLARRAGSRRLANDCSQLLRDVLQQFVGNTLRTAVAYIELGGRRTVTVQDVVRALQSQGRSVYGF